MKISETNKTISRSEEKETRDKTGSKQDLNKRQNLSEPQGCYPGLNKKKARDQNRIKKGSKQDQNRIKTRDKISPVTYR